MNPSAAVAVASLCFEPGEEASKGDIVRNDEDFYSDADKYWKGIPATVNGMLGGFGNLSSTDIANSKKFLLPLIKGPDAVIASPDRALDCGAGIGRVSKRLLLPLFSQVDLVELNADFLHQARVYLGEIGSKVGNYYPCGLQDFTPQEGYYDVIWMQWVLSHLTDDDLVAFLLRCVKALNPRGGLLVAKENITEDEDNFDEQDSSVTRCNESLLRLFERANLKIIKQEDQKNFPRQMFRVRMFALVPVSKQQCKPF